MFKYLFLFLMSPVVLLAAPNIIELNDNADDLLMGSRVILLTSVVSTPLDEESEIYVENIFDDQPIKSIQFGATEYAAITPSINTSGSFLWKANAYLQNKSLVNSLKSSIFSAEMKKYDFEILWQEETDEIKKEKLQQIILEIEDEILMLKNQIAGHRVLVQSVEKTFSLSGIKKANNLILPQLQIVSEPGSLNYGDASEIHVKVNPGNIGTNIYEIFVQVNGNTQKLIQTGQFDYKSKMGVGETIWGSNSIEYNFYFTDLLKSSSMKSALQALDVFLIEKILLRDSSLDPDLIAYYNAEINELNYIKSFFSVYQSSLRKQGETISSSFYVYDPLTTFTKVATSTSFTCGIYKSAVTCWGSNTNGQLGLGNTINTTRPTDPVVGLDKEVHELSLGVNHACAIKGRSLYCWGSNSFGQLGELNNPGGLVPAKVNLPEPVTKVALGLNHSCAVADESVYCWGNNSAGQVGQESLSSVFTPANVGLTDIVDVKAGNQHTCALNTSGNIYCWGSNTMLQVGLGGSYKPTHQPFLTGISKIAAGGNNTCAVIAGGVKCWGSNNFLQMGTLFSGDMSSAPIDILGLNSDVSEVSIGGSTICALQNSAAKCLGNGALGAMGNGSTSVSQTIVDVTGMSSDVLALSEGVTYGCAIQSGSLKCWGRNVGGILGNGTTVNSLVPVTVLTPTGSF